MKKKISVSFLSSEDEIDDLVELDSTDVDFIHVDVMDGKFVKNKNFPFKILDRLSYVLKKRLDVHLMVKKPLKFIEKYAMLNVEYITLHVELRNLKEYFDVIKTYGIKCGIAINPDTELEKIDEYIDDIDLILIMSVMPGKGGQQFLPDTTKRIEAVKEKIGNRNILISVDGGINDTTIDMVKDSDIVVSGSYIINGDNFQQKIDSLR